MELIHQTSQLLDDSPPHNIDAAYIDKLIKVGAKIAREMKDTATVSIRDQWEFGEPSRMWSKKLQFADSTLLHALSKALHVAERYEQEVGVLRHRIQVLESMEDHVSGDIFSEPTGEATEFVVEVVRADRILDLLQLGVVCGRLGNAQELAQFSFQGINLAKTLFENSKHFDFRTHVDWLTLNLPQHLLKLRYNVTQACLTMAKTCLSTAKPAIHEELESAVGLAVALSASGFVSTATSPKAQASRRGPPLLLRQISEIPEVTQALFARAVNNRGVLLCLRNELQHGVTQLQRSVEIAKNCGFEQGIVESLRNTGIAFWKACNTEQAAVALRASLQLRRSIDGRSKEVQEATQEIVDLASGREDTSELIFFCFGGYT